MKKLFLILSLIFVYEMSFAQWQQLKGPIGGTAYLFNNNGVLYAGTAAGVYVSENRGATWEQRNNGLLKDSILEWTSFIQSFAAIGNKVFAGTEGGVVMTTDKGSSWKLVFDSLSFFTGVPVLATGGGLLLAGTESNGMYMSADSGLTWKNVLIGGPYKQIEMILTIGNKIMADYYGVTGYLTSSDTGKTWVATQTILSGRSINSMNFNNGLLYAATDSGIFVSRDSGNTWNSGITGLHDYGNSFFNGNYVYSSDAVYSRPNDTSLSWNWLCNMKLSPLNYNSLYFGCLAGDTIFAVGNGLFWSNDNAVTWHNDNTQLYNAPVEALAVNDYGIIAANDSGVYFSPDEGNTWKLANKKYGGYGEMITKGNEIFHLWSDSLFVSRDNGYTWQPVNIVHGLDLVNGCSVAANGDNIFVSCHWDSSYFSQPRTYWSNNDGASWTQVFKSLPQEQYSSCLAGSFAFASDTVFVNSCGYLFYSVNNGISWVQLDSGSNNSFDLIAVNGNNLVSINDFGEFLFSKDRGITWQVSLYSEVNRDDIFTIFAVNDTFYAGDGYGGTYFSPDSGMNWFASNPINFCTPSYAVHNGSIYVGGGQGTGVWKHYSSAATITNGIPEIKRSNAFILYPNPAEDMVTIVTGKNNITQYELSIYNLLGKLMIQQTINTQSLPLDIRLFPSGVYFIRISDENGLEEVKKFVKQ